MIDVEEAEDSYLIEADLPGVPADAVTIDVRANEVGITADTQQQERHGVMRQQMRRTGRYECAVRLPGDVDAERSEARMSDGVLRLKLAKVSATAARHVPVIEAGGHAGGETRSVNGAGSRSESGRGSGSRTP
jgi:HSP20 family protein